MTPQPRFPWLRQGLTFIAYWLRDAPKHSNIQQFYVLPTQCIYVFCVDLRTQSDYFPIQH